MANDVLKSLEQLFSARIFRIPNYQRGYSWGKQQLKELWEDLANIVDGHPYYIGMISIEEAKQADTDKWDDDAWYFEAKPNLKAYYVVDGQQRLTTIILLLAKIVEVASRHGLTKLGITPISDIIKQYFYITNGDENMAQFKSYIFGYVYDNPSHQHFRKLLGDDKVVTSIKTSYTLNLDYAYNVFFEEKVNELFDRDGEAGIKKLFIKLTSSLRFMEFIIDNDEFDTYVAFETMNNRGKRLTYLELLKNRLMYLSTLYYGKHFTSMKQVQLLHNDINKCWSHVYEQLGRNPDKPLPDDDMLNEHWKIFFSYNRSESDAFASYLLNEHFIVQSVMNFLKKKESAKPTNQENESDDDSTAEESNIENVKVITEGAEDSPKIVEDKIEKDVVSDKDIQTYVYNLSKFSENWFYSFFPDYCETISDDEKEWITKLNRLGTGNFQVLIAVLISSKLPSEKKLECLKAIERFIFIVFRLAQYNQSYISYDIYNFTKELSNGGGDVDEFINKLRTETDTIAASPATINRFCETTKNLFARQQGFYSWQTKNYFLFEYEYEYRATTGVKRLDWKDFTDTSKKGRISIEHVYPQKPYSMYWRNQFRGFNKKERFIFTNTLGNILPLAQSVNSSLQNFDFEIKKNGYTSDKGEHRRGYSEGSYSEQEVAKIANWGPTEIVNRGKSLLSFLERRWGIAISDENKLKVLGFYDFDPLRDQGPEIETNLYGSHQDDVLNFLNTRNENVAFLYDLFLEYLTSLDIAVFEELNPYASDSLILKDDEGNVVTSVSFRKESLRFNGNNYIDNERIGENDLSRKGTQYLHGLKYWFNVGNENDFEMAKTLIFGGNN